MLTDMWWRQVGNMMLQHRRDMLELGAAVRDLTRSLRVLSSTWTKEQEEDTRWSTVSCSFSNFLLLPRGSVWVYLYHCNISSSISGIFNEYTYSIIIMIRLVYEILTEAHSQVRSVIVAALVLLVLLSKPSESFAGQIPGSRMSKSKT